MIKISNNILIFINTVLKLANNILRICKEVLY